jgi:hypothetical protein
MAPESVRPFESLSEAEQAYLTAVNGADILWGGDVGQPGGGAHMIADSHPRDEVALPPIYHDKNAQIIRANGGADPKVAGAVRDFIFDNGLLDTRVLLAQKFMDDPDLLRQHFMTNMGASLGVMTRTALASVDKRYGMPSFEARFRAATAGQHPKMVETAELREQLRAALADVGFETGSRRGLKETLGAWEHKVGFVPPEAFGQKVADLQAILLQGTRDNIFAAMDFGIPGYNPDLSDVAFDGQRFGAVSNVSWTGSSAYGGGISSDGKPALGGLIEYNTDHPITNVAFPHLIAHEMTPGHYLDSAVADLGWHSGKHGIEAAAHTMCTDETTMREGWAQNALAMLFGGSEQTVIDVLGRDQAVQYVLERLTDAGKLNSAMLLQGMGQSLDEVKRHLSVDCLLSDIYVKKLAGWAQHPIVGPMYGPAYEVGYKVVREAIDTYGPEQVANAAFHKYGYTGIGTFQEALKKAA